MGLHLPSEWMIAGLRLNLHAVFETLAYMVGVRLYFLTRPKAQSADPYRFSLIAGAVVGAALGSRILGLAEHPEIWSGLMQNPVWWLTAKTIYGGLVGGWIGVEVVKHANHIQGATGDAYVMPLSIAMMIGRLGCLCAGVSDGTWGTPTHFLLGMDGGDGILRHPTPLYEMIGLGGLLIGLRLARSQIRLRPGEEFRLFIAAYSLWRFGIEWLKPVVRWPPLHLSIIQMAALGVFLYCLADLIRHRRTDAVNLER